MKNAFRPETTFHRKVALSFVIRAKPKDLQFRGPFMEMFFNGLVMGLRTTQCNEKCLESSHHSQWHHNPPLCHPERSRGIRSSADPSWKCFSTELEMGFSQTLF
jgi:hypothetical protein